MVICNYGTGYCMDQLLKVVKGGKRMAVKEFYKLLKEKDLQEIIYMHCFEKITLTEKQLDKVLKLKKKKEAENWKN